MLYLTMKFETIESVKHFVECADKLTSRIDVETNTMVINGKSLLGLCAVAMEGAVTVIIEDCDETVEFVNMLKSQEYGAIVKEYIQ